MSKFSKLLILAAVITGFVLVINALSRRSRTGAASDIQASATETASAETAQSGHTPFFTNHARRHAAHRATGQPPMDISGSGATVLTAWEEKVEEVLGTRSPDLDKAKQMMELFPRLPAEGQEEVARHLSNLVPDEEYGLMNAYLTNAALPEDVLDVLLDDALNRPNSLKLPALLAMAQNPQHPKAEEAKDFLELFLDEDYGNDWNQWQVKMGQWLAANPD
jgi:hypothetical protein